MMKLHGALDLQKGSQSYMHSASDCIIWSSKLYLTIA